MSDARLAAHHGAPTPLPRDPNRNFLALGAGEAASRLIAFGATVFLARAFGAEGYGVVAFAAGLALYVMKLADFAMDYVGSAVIAGERGGTSTDRVASVVLSARVAFAITLVAVATMVVRVAVPEPERTVLTWYFVALVPLAFNPKWVLLGLHDARAVGVVRVVGESVALAVVVLLVRSGTGLWAAPVAVGAGEALAAGALLLVVRMKNVRVRPRWDLASALPVFRRAAPVVGLSLLGLLLFNSGLFFLRAVRDREAVGYYAAAYTLIGFLSNVGLAYAMSLIPGLTHLGRGTKGELALYHRSLAQSVAVALPVAAGAFLFSRQIIELAFGPGYSESAVALAVLAWSIPLATVRNVPLAALIARGKQGLLVRATLFAAGGNIALNAALAAPFGVVGVTIAAVLTECLAGVLMLRYASREGLELVSPRRLWRSALATAAMAIVVGALGRPTLAVGVPIGMSVYAIVLAAVGGIRFRGGPIPSLEV